MLTNELLRSWQNDLVPVGQSQASCLPVSSLHANHLLVGASHLTDKLPALTSSSNSLQSENKKKITISKIVKLI